jgi:hypothetical protein
MARLAAIGRCFEMKLPTELRATVISARTSMIGLKELRICVKSEDIMLGTGSPDRPHTPQSSVMSIPGPVRVNPQQGSTTLKIVSTAATSPKKLILGSEVSLVPKSISHPDRLDLRGPLKDPVMAS